MDEALNQLLNQTTEYINEVVYPADKSEIVAAARKKDAPAPVLAVLDELPEKTYRDYNALLVLVVDLEEGRAVSAGGGRRRRGLLRKLWSWPFDE